VIGTMLLAAAAFAALGLWQLLRAEEARTRIDRFAAAAADVALEHAVDDAAAELYRYRRLELRGRYEPGFQVLLDQVVREGKTGYEVLTPFRTSDSSRWLLVNRGFVEAPADRRVLPDVDVDAEARTLAGRIDLLPRPGLVLGSSTVVERRAGLSRMLFPSAAEIASEIGHPVRDYQLLLDAREPDGFIREWRAAGAAPERHIAYAGQWFVFAVGAVAVAGAIARPLVRR
jgi:surfeit locus 1 family protein